MAKAVLAIATAFLTAMTVLVSAGGPSYESRGYGGPLYVGPNFQAGGQHSPPSYGPKSSSKERYKKQRVYRATNKRNAPATKEVDTAKSTPIKGEAKSENSTISGASPDTNKTGAASKVDTVENAQSENSSISAASLDTDKTVEKDTVKSEAMDEAKTTNNVGCKKYFPSAGVTLTVPCE